MRNNNTIRYDVLRYQGLSALYALGLSLWAGTIYLYMKQVGYSYGQINLFLALFWLVTCLTEIPSGFLADMFGALKLTFLSSLFRGSGLLFLALFEHNLTILVLSAILMTPSRKSRDFSHGMDRPLLSPFMGLFVCFCIFLVIDIFLYNFFAH
ncbi:hypothetical protein NSA02_08315, partial [Ligilactobacillus murinus]|nr:hypothetical protein [Ligilactobacillus murinus]